MTRYAIIWALAALAGCLVTSATTATPPTPGDGPVARAPVEIIAGTYLFADPDGNALLHVGPRDSIVVGALTPRVTASVLAFLAAQHAAPVRFALATDGPQAARYGDGGWGAAGAVTIAHERLRSRMTSAMGSATQPGKTADAALPMLGFSAVQQMYLSDDDVHAVHQDAGASDADLSVHFERSNVLFLGALLCTDGFPDLDLDNGGSIDGLIKTVDFFAKGFGPEPGMHFIPARGAAATGADLEEYLQMLQAARAQVQALIDAGLHEHEIAARDPLRPLAARWGRGAVSTEEFTSRVTRSLQSR